MRPNFRVLPYALCVFTALVAIGVAARSAHGQCTPPSPPTFTVTSGPTHHHVTYTISGIASTATIELWNNASSEWTPAGSYLPPGGSWQVGGFAHNFWVLMRAQNHQGADCSSPWVTASAFTPDVGFPWLHVGTDYVGGVMAFTGPVPPDMASVVLFSDTGVEPFTILGVFWQNGQGFIQMAPNKTYYIYAQIDLGNQPRRTEVQAFRLEPDQDYGDPGCRVYRPKRLPEAPKAQGEPVNVTNGNMFLDQTDYRLSGIGESIDVTRSYNSMVSAAGMFGIGWSSPYDERITLLDARNIRLAMPDGRGTYYARQTTSGPFAGITPGFEEEIVQNPDGTYTLTFDDGRVHKFYANGRLKELRDRNGNATTLTFTDPVNGTGSLTAVTDAFGRTLNVAMNGNGTVAKIWDSLSSEQSPATAYEYFPSPDELRLKSVMNQDGSKYEFEYVSPNAPGKMTAVKDANGKILEKHDYDTQGRATTSEIEGGQERYVFDYSNAAFTTVTDVLGRVTKYHFNRSGIRTVVKKVEGLCSCGGGGTESTEYFYDARLNLLKKVDALGRETTYTYDSNRNNTQETDPYGTQKWTYNSFGQVLTYQDRVDSQSQNPVYTAVMTYDSKGNPLTYTDALQKVTTLAYPITNNKGLPNQVTNARNKVTKFKWFSNSGLLQEIEDPYTKKTNFAYDARGRLKTVTNALSHVTQYNYFDDTQRKVEMVYPNADKITYKYDIRRLLETVTDERGKITTYEFDPQYRLKKITDPLSHVKEFGYDLMSNMTSYKDPLGFITDYKFDDFNRLKEVEYPAASQGATRLKEKFEYDKTGRIKKYFDTANRLTEYGYDDADGVNTVTNPDLETTTTKYNQRLQTTEVKDAINQVYIFSYDPLGRMLSQSRAGGTMSFEYDEVGNRKKRTDYAGRVTNYIYDDVNRLTKIVYTGGAGNPTPNLESTYGYDFISRLTSAVNETGTVSFAYDNRNRLTSTTDVFGKVLAYEYERTSEINQKRLKLDGSLYATYNFDDAERLSNIVNASDSTTISFGYDNEDKITSRTYPNGVSTAYSYFDDDLLKRITDTGPGGTLFDRQYSYNSAKQISQITEPSLTRVFGYDNADRLTGVTGGTTESYGYDDVGNRTSSHLSSTYGYQSGQFNQLISTTSSTMRYDTNGNLVQKTEGSNYWRYIWDHENRLTEAGNRKTKARYKYDALGRRVGRYTGTKGSTKFTYEGADVLLDDDSVSGVTKYVNGPGIDNKLRLQTGSSVSYFLADHLGSTNGLANSSGGVTSQTAYDSFGNQTASLNTRYGFTGRERDDVSGLMYYRARFYDPGPGRFISEDPIGFKGGDINLHGYVRNQPLRFRDPRGLQADAYVLQNPYVLQQLIQQVGTVVAAGGAAVVAIVGGAASSPIVVAGAGLAAGVAIGYYPGQWTANDPSNPYVNGRLNPFGTPYPMLPPFVPTGRPGSVCQVRPRPIPWTLDRADPWPTSPSDREGCHEEISDCHQKCTDAQYDQDAQGRFGGAGGIWGGNYETCMRGCITARCRKGTRWE